MKTKDLNTLRSISLLAAIAAAFSVADAAASGYRGAGDNTQLLYQSREANHAIHGYAGSVPEQVSARPELVYVSQAYGPAIYSYRHAGSERSVAFNAEYVDTAYGQAIHSYERARVEGEVRILPLLVR